MSYVYRSSGKPWMIDLLKVTPRGIKAGLSAGYVIPIGYLYAGFKDPDILHILTKFQLSGKYQFRYTVKHCDKPNIMTHIVPSGVVNQFGWFYTHHKIKFDDHVFPPSLDIGRGWFKRISIEPTEEAFAKL